MSAQKPTPLVAGNWKMNGLKAAQSELLGIIERVSNAKPQADVMLCPPATLLARFADVASDSAVAIGAQDCHAQPSGAHTGDVSAEMLKDAGASAVIVGHSERRADHGESDRDVHDKALAAYGVGLIAIICVGETEAQRDAGQTLDIVGGQLRGSVPDAAAADNTVIAYEPVWAIGTGKVPSRQDVAEVHAMIRERLVERFGGAGRAMRILYGGSVKPSNAAALMTVENVDGALVGGASLKARDFDGILDAYR